tara:strand:+ start:1479 stop:1634 length:156 start_codon:yes stop_codon:yes gene_type:complete
MASVADDLDLLFVCTQLAPVFVMSRKATVLFVLFVLFMRRFNGLVIPFAVI